MQDKAEPPPGLDKSCQPAGLRVATESRRRDLTALSLGRFKRCRRASTKLQAFNTIYTTNFWIKDRWQVKSQVLERRRPRILYKHG